MLTASLNWFFTIMSVRTVSCILSGVHSPSAADHPLAPTRFLCRSPAPSTFQSRAYNLHIGAAALILTGNRFLPAFLYPPLAHISHTLFSSAHTSAHAGLLRRTIGSRRVPQHAPPVSTPSPLSDRHFRTATVPSPDFPFPLTFPLSGSYPPTGIIRADV